MKISAFFPDGPFCHVRKVAGSLEKRRHSVFAGRDLQADVVFAADVSVAEAAHRVGMELAKPVCQQVLDLPEWRFEDPYFKGKYETYRRVLREAAKVVSISQATARTLKDLWGIESEVVGYPVDDEAIKAVEDPGERLHQVISVGRFDLRKNFHQAIQALSLVKDAPEFVLVGPSHSVDPGLYIRLAREYGVKIRLLTSAPDDSKFWEMKRSKILIAPSVFEGLGLPPIEAILCGTPVVVNDMPVAREIFREDAAWCDGRDPASIAKAVSGLLADPGSGLAMVEKLRPKMEYFSMARYAERLLKVLERLVRNDGCPPAPGPPSLIR